MEQRKLGIKDGKAYQAGLAALAEVFNESSLTAAALAIADPFAVDKAAPFNAKMEMAEEMLTALAKSVSGTKVEFHTRNRRKNIDGVDIDAECRQVTVAIAGETGVRVANEKPRKAPTVPQGKNLEIRARILTDAEELYEYRKTVENIESVPTISRDEFTQVLDWWMFPNGVHRIFTAEEAGVIREGELLDATCGGTVSFADTQILENAAFKGYEALKTVCFTHCLNIGKEAFSGCRALSKVILPQCQSAGDEAFRHCKSLQRIELPMCINIGDSAFADCVNLSEVILPEVMMLGDSVFSGCTSLEEISLPGCDDIAENAFTGCTALKKIHLSDINEDEIRDCEGFEIGFGVSEAEICFDL